MNDPTYDCPAGAHPFSILDDLGNVLVDSSSPTNGFDINFNPCTTYDPLTPSPCYLRYNLTWIPQCPALGLCNSPQVIVQGQLLATGTGGVSLNTTAYNINYNLR
jgi:hypothetical protein